MKVDEKIGSQQRLINYMCRYIYFACCCLLFVCLLLSIVGNGEEERIGAACW